MHTKVGASHFGWKGVGVQCGVYFGKPRLLNLSFAAHFLSIHQSPSEIPHHMRKSSQELLLANHCATQSQSQMDHAFEKATTTQDKSVAQDQYDPDEI